MHETEGRGIGVGYGGAGGINVGARPPPQKKKSEKHFFGQSCKSRAFSGILLIFRVNIIKIREF